MMNRIKSTMLAGLAALTLTLGVEAPASAQVFHGHGGGFHGGFHGGYGYRGYRGGWGPGIGLGIVGGLAAGALIAGAYPYGYGYGYGYGGCYRPRPTYDAYGNYLGTRVVNVCY